MNEPLHSVQSGIESTLGRCALYAAAWIAGFYSPIVVVLVVLSGIRPADPEAPSLSGFSFFALPLISIFIHPLGILTALLGGIGAVVFTRFSLRLYWLSFPFVVAALHAIVVVKFQK